MLPLQVGKYHSRSHEEARQLSERGMAYVERALAADEKNFNCHKWMGILLSWSSEFYGYKKKIERTYDIKTHFEVHKSEGCVHESTIQWHSPCRSLLVVAHSLSFSL